MHVKLRSGLFCWVAFILSVSEVEAQDYTTVPNATVTVVAGKQYKRSGLYQWLWGKNRRQEWTMPVTVPVVSLDTVYGGLIPYQKGGGNESKSLRLRSASGKEFVLRSVNKSREDVTPRIFKIPVFGGIIQDGVSMSHPYAAVAIPVMLDQAGIPHTRPRLVFVPQQPVLDTFNARFGNDLYFLEERPAGDWSDQAHLGQFQKFISTLELLQKMQKAPSVIADQHGFIKARLFDILIADWDRHHDNWRWGESEVTGKKYIPVPRDRDQAFFTRDGRLTKLLVPVTRVRFMQNFGYKIKNVRTLTSQDRKLDRLFTNAMALDDWLQAARELQQSLSDTVIEQSVKELPSEIFVISGRELIEKLKVRRNNLENYAARFYSVLAKKVEINGSDENEYFVAKAMKEDQVSVKIFRVDKSGLKEATAYYQRVFSAGETKLITMNGFGGQDTFDVPESINGIKLLQNTGKSKNPLFKWAEKD